MERFGVKNGYQMLLAYIVNHMNERHRTFVHNAAYCRIWLSPDLRRVLPERPLSNPARLIIPAIFEVSGLLSFSAAGAPGDIPALRSG